MVKDHQDDKLREELNILYYLCSHESKTLKTKREKKFIKIYEDNCMMLKSFHNVMFTHAFNEHAIFQKYIH